MDRSEVQKKSRQDTKQNKGESNMKKLAIAVAVLVGMAGVAGAGTHSDPSDTTSVKAEVTPVISVLVTGSVDLGVMSAGTTDKDSLTGLTVKNDGSGVVETYTIKLTNPATWSAVAGVPSVEQYRLQAQLNDSSSVAPITGSWVPGTMALSETLAALAGGAGITYNTTKYLWFRFDAPSATAVTVARTIDITITAGTP
jgi:hypothetical protein